MTTPIEVEKMLLPLPIEGVLFSVAKMIFMSNYHRCYASKFAWQLKIESNKQEGKSLIDRVPD